MRKIKYIKWSKYDVISDFLGTCIWVSLITFTIISKNLMSVNIITFLESFVFIFSLLGTYIAFRHIGTIKVFIILDILLESIFLLFIIYLILIESNYIALAIYSVVIIGKLIRPALQEKKRKYEDLFLNKKSEKNLLAKIRERSEYFSNTAAVIGSMLAILFVSILNISITNFALFMLFLNVVQNVFDYYKWFKFMK